MRIGIEIKHLEPLRGGAETYVCRLAEWLGDGGHEVHLLAHNVTWAPKNSRSHLVSPYWPSRLRTVAQSLRLDVLIGTDKCLGMNVFHPHRGTIRGNLRQELARLRSPAVRRILRGAYARNPRYLAARFFERQ